MKDHNFWIINIPKDCSWIWRKVLQFRNLDGQFISYSIGDGSNISLWSDPWLAHASLAPSLSLVSLSGLGVHAKFSSLIENRLGLCLLLILESELPRTKMSKLHMSWIS